MAILATCNSCGKILRVRDEYLDKKAWCPFCKAPITLTGERVPNHEVFISYSNKDKHVADAICAKLEALPLRCWIAPRDVAAGHSWGSSIIEAIEEAKVMVMVYSGNSNLSPQVIREVERAVAKGLVLVPFRIEATMMTKDMEYFLSASHWIDALTPPLEQHLVELGELVRTVLFRKEKEAAAAQKPVQPAEPVPPAPASPTSQPKSRNKMWIAAAVALVAILGIAGWWFEQRRSTNPAAKPTSANLPAFIAPQAGAQIGFLREKSMTLYPNGYQAPQGGVAQVTQDATEVFTGKPVYFNQQTGTEVRYKVESTTPVVKLIYRGVAFKSLFLSALDMNGNALTTRGPFGGGNIEKTIELNIPNATSFELVLRSDSSTWLLIKSIQLENAGGALLPMLTKPLTQRSPTEIASAESNPPLSWVIPTVSEADTNGWITLFDGKKFYGCDPNNDRIVGKNTVLRNGELWVDESCFVFPVDVRNAIMRARVKKVSGQHVALAIGPYFGWFNGGRDFGICQPNHKDVSSKSSVPFRDYFDMEFRLIGGKCTLLANGETVSTLEGAPLADPQEVKLWTLKGLSVFQKIEVKVLDDKAANRASSSTPVTVRASATDTAGAAITISCSEEVHILPLEAGQPTLYNSSPHPIESVSQDLSGWQFVSVPWHTINSYEIRINQDGVLYVFGGGNDNRKSFLAWLGPQEVGKWEAADGAISGTFNFCFRRKVSSGEIIKLKGLELLLASKSIQLKAPAANKETDPSTQPTMPVPTPAVVVPQSSVQSGQPWTNSLGMKFVPVPGTAVQFSIWDTRVQDYQAFVTATGYVFDKPTFEQGPTHPVVFISWKRAKAFCAWLTTKERSEGRIAAQQFYRLPTDLEWSTAVGLKNEPGNTPAERNGQVKGVYPWGTTWPPPRGAGNFGQRLHLEDFANTSPVGTFAPNQFGLYDMAGNVVQWCEDPYDEKGDLYVQRGSSWKNFSQDHLLSSRRSSWGATFRDGGFGFRCVLANSEASAP
jgi:formylglycine-generating enzyme required for sulfatase activity